MEGLVNAAYLDLLTPYAAGSLYLTVGRPFKWDQTLLDDKTLSADSKKLMFTPGLGNYGYGIRISDMPIGKTDQKIKSFGHGGSHSKKMLPEGCRVVPGWLGRP